MVAAVERKSLAYLASSLLSGKLTYALAELAALPRAAVVVEDRYSALFKLEHVVPGRVAEALAEAQARFPAVPVFFAEARPLAQEWTYRFLGAALVEVAGAGVRFTPDPSLSPSEAPPLARTPTAAAGPADQGCDLCRLRRSADDGSPPPPRLWRRVGQRSGTSRRDG